LTKLLDQYGLKNKIIAYVKDEGSNLNTMIIVLKSIVKCEIFGLDKKFQGSCFDHAFSKACQYVIINKKKLQESQVYFNQIYLVKFAEMYNLP
jgi:hypothetical protein